MRLFHACCQAKNDFLKEPGKKYIKGDFFEEEASAENRLAKVKKALKKRFRWHNAKINKSLADARVDQLKNYVLTLLRKANQPVEMDLDLDGGDD